MDIPQVKKCVYMLVLEHVNEQCQKRCSKTKEKSSVLQVSRAVQKNLAEFKWISILREMKERTSDVLDFLTTVAIPRVKEDTSQVPALCTAFGLSMNMRSRELALVQKVSTVVLGAGNATKTPGANDMHKQTVGRY